METKLAKRGTLALLLAAALAFACAVLTAPAAAYAEEAPDPSEGIEPTPDNVYHIKSANDFLAYVALSRERDTTGWEVYLDVDLTLNDDDMNAIVGSTVKHLSFGNKEHPFKGLFDGRNHTVSGLNYENRITDPERDTGFFAETDGAIIKNFLVKDANVWADFRGGVIVGKAVNTTFENVMVMESTLHVTCANNTLNLITNAGFEGGLIAGELDACALYNCEVRGGRAVNNTTSAVQALGGEGLYMAAFAGYVTNSTIEYCRVTPTRKADGSIAEKGMTDVTNKYDVAVGALGGNNVYASGFVGCMAGGAKIIDCFSTAQCYSYAASYVGVIAVTRAWTGGLAGRVLSKSDNELVRSHFAGDLSSRQYNPIAVIPIIQDDVNLGGLGGRANAGDATTIDCYFKPSVSLNGFSQGDPKKKKIPAWGGDGTAAGEGYGPWDDESYVTRELWEEHDYDFCAGTMRSTANDACLNGPHANEWAMDYRLGIPVHGQSVKATIDFPGAGTATIKETKLGEDQSTSDPYAFAVSAVLAGTAQGLAEGDTSVTFEQQTLGKPNGLTEANGGYRFMGWFRERNVDVNRIDADNSWFDGKTDADAVANGKRVEENKNHDTTSTYTADNGKNAGGGKGFQGNDLFIASYEAQALFYNVKGETLDWQTGIAHDKSTDWYRYGTGLMPAAPADCGALSDSATFIGWTTRPSGDAEMHGGYKAIISTDLAKLKTDGVFYPAGAKVTVVGPMDFYPVYSDYVSNIKTVFEGYEQDDPQHLDVPTYRRGVGKTRVVASKSDAGQSAYAVQVFDVNDLALSDGGTLPDGYRFLGWYENKGTEENPLEVRVSRDPSYTLPADVDLTVPHTYTARFEYRVDYWACAFRKGESGVFEPQKVYSIWQAYKTPFNEVSGVSYLRDEVVHWGADYVNHQADTAQAENCSERFTNEMQIVAPLTAKSHNLQGSQGGRQYKVMMDTDFPGSGDVLESYKDNNDIFSFIPVNGRYDLRFWTLEKSRGIGKYWTYAAVRNEVTGSYEVALSGLGSLDSEVYYGRAMVTTDIGFHSKEGSRCFASNRGAAQMGTRCFGTSLLMDADLTHTYRYPFYYTDKEVGPTTVDGKTVSSQLTLQASPSDADMAVDGYKFLGWISTAEVQKDSAVWNYIYDVAGDSYTTSDPDKVAPYLVTRDSKVTQSQDAYPVYAKHDIRYTTNLHRSGFDGIQGEVNVPRYDIVPAISENVDSATATVSPDIATTVYADGTGGDYQLKKVEIELPSGEVKAFDPSDDNSYSYTVEPSGTYTFVAYYSPLAVVYHLNDSDIDGKVAQEGQKLGNLKGGIPKPTYAVADIDAAQGTDGQPNQLYAFVGWTQAKPSGASKYVIWSDKTPMVSKSTVVKAPMELYPVYRACTAQVQSNIDDDLTNPGSIRGFERSASGDQVSLVAETHVEGGESKTGTSYDFVGWSRDYGKTEDGSYTLMTEAARHPLKGNEPFEQDATYTAVYKVSPHQVRYHGVDGSVIFTALVDSTDDRASGSGFVYEVDMPAKDTEGNEVPDGRGGTLNQKKKVAYDPEAYVNITTMLDDRVAQHGNVYREMFLQWRWVANDGSVKTWNEFKNEPITGDMDLYPETFYVVAYDTSNNAKPSDSNMVTQLLGWQLDPNAANTVAADSDCAPIKTCFTKPYSGTQLTISVVHVNYRPIGEDGARSDRMPVDDKYVSLYSLGSGGGSFDLADRLDSKLTGDGDQGAGNAVFDFAATHTLKIVKQTQDSWAKGKTFRFKVARADMDGKPLEERTVEVTVSPDAQHKDGGTWYSGAIELAVPAGIYTVEEDAAWAWRYSSQIGVPGKQPGDKAQATISAASSANDATFTCTNTRVKDKWIDGGDRAHNVWSDSNVAKKED